MKLDDKQRVTEEEQLRFIEELLGIRLSGGILTVGDLKRQAAEDGHTREEVDAALEAVYAPKQVLPEVITLPTPEKESLGRRVLSYFMSPLTTNRAALLASALLTAGASFVAGDINQQVESRDEKLTVAMFPHRTGSYEPPTYVHEGTFPGTDISFVAEKRQDFMGGETLEIPAASIPDRLAGYKEIVRDIVNAYLAENPQQSDQLRGLEEQVADPAGLKLTRTAWWGGWGTQRFEIGSVLDVAYNQDCELKWVRAVAGSSALEFFDKEAALYCDAHYGGLEVKNGFAKGYQLREKLEAKLRGTMDWIRSVNHPEGSEGSYPLELCGI